MMWEILKYPLTLVAIVGITALVIAVYEIILAFQVNYEIIQNRQIIDYGTRRNLHLRGV